MILTAHLFSPNNTGAPDYNICGQVASIIDFTNVSLKITLSDFTNSQVAVTTSNLAGSVAAITGTHTFGDLDVNVVSFSRNAGTGSISLNMNFYKVGTTSPCTWRRVFATIEVSKVGYQSFTNTFEIYGYDIGNDITLGYSGNPIFDIYLVNNTNNLDVNGKQTKAFSAFSIIRQPFTDNIYLYNMVGTQGNITYYDTDIVPDLLIGNGKSTKVCITADTCGDNGATLKQKIVLYDGNILLDSCESTKIVNRVQWLPIVSTTSSCPTACDNCVNNLSPVIISTTVDYEGVTPFKLNNTVVFLTQFMVEETVFQLLDFQGIEIDKTTIPYVITYADWLNDKASFLVPIEYTVATPPLGDTKVIVTHTFTDGTTIFIACLETLLFKVCHWWTVSKGLECGSYIFNNCSQDVISIVLQKFNNDKSLTDLVTIVVQPFSSIDLSLQGDGIYVLKVPSRDLPNTFEYYTIASFCGLEECWLKYLNEVICCKVDDDCKACEKYKFMAFLINAHTFFMAINQEFNFSFIYSIIDDTKITDLYVLDEFITRFREYCGDDCTPCKTY